MSKRSSTKPSVAAAPVPAHPHPGHRDEHPVNDDEALVLAKKLLAEGYSPTTAAGAFVHEVRRRGGGRSVICV